MGKMLPIVRVSAVVMTIQAVMAIVVYFLVANPEMYIVPVVTVVTVLLAIEWKKQVTEKRLMRNQLLAEHALACEGCPKCGW
jgi:hypothetical protein